jgi:general secretion pathway protein J
MRDELGDTWRPSVLVNPSAQFAMEISRGGWANPAGFPRGTTLRVAYDWEDGTLIRFHWPVMDRAPGTVPVRTELLEDVADVQLQFLDQSGTWHFEWPPTGMAGPDTLVMRPRVVRFDLELDDFGRVWRDVETGG